MLVMLGALGERLVSPRVVCLGEVLKGVLVKG